MLACANLAGAQDYLSRYGASLAESRTAINLVGLGVPDPFGAV